MESGYVDQPVHRSAAAVATGGRRARSTAGPSSEQPGHHDAASWYAVATDTYAAWAESSGAAAANVGGYLVPKGSDQVLSVGNTSGLYAMLGAGDYLVWQDSKSPRISSTSIYSTIARLNG